MDEKLIEIREYSGPGYQPLIDFAGWRVAILNYLDEIHPERIDYVERHTATDEVFVLLKGQGVLFVGSGATHLESLVPQVMEIGKIYNVKQGTWHTIVLSPDGSVLLVENCDTGDDNSEFSSLQPEHNRLILETARREQAHWRK